MFTWRSRSTPNFQLPDVEANFQLMTLTPTANVKHRFGSWEFGSGSDWELT